MKKNFIRASVFLLVLFWLFIGVSYVLRPYDDTKDRFAGFNALEKNSMDMVMIGSSPVHPYYAASLAYDKYGFLSYPLATSVQAPCWTEFLVKEALKTQKPELLVIETRMFMREQSEFDKNEQKEVWVRSVTDNVKYSPQRFLAINSKVKGDKEAYWFDIIKYHSLWKIADLSSLKYWNYENKSIYSGFLFVPRVEKQELIVNNEEITDETPIPPEQEKILYEIIDYAKKKNQEVAFILAPYVITEGECKMANYMERIVKEAGCEYINFNKLNEEMDIDYQMDFYNGGHMNIFGTEKYTIYIGKLLQEKYNLPDHRSDEAYASWDSDYEVWRQQAEVTKEQIRQMIEGGTVE